MSVSVFINLLKYVVNMSDEKHNAGNEGTFELYVINVSHHIPLVDRIVLVPDLTTFLNLDFFFFPTTIPETVKLFSGLTLPYFCA